MKKNIAISLFVCAFFISSGELARAEKVCIKVTQNKRTKKITTARKIAATCPRGYTSLLDTATLVGPTGATGANGIDGEAAVYGSGSMGDLVVANGVLMYPLGTAQYANVTIQSGGTLRVDSGTIIRCTGTFTNDGAIEVTNSSNGGTFAAASSLASGAVRAPSTGIARTVAGSPGYVSSGSYSGGSGGEGLGAANFAEGTIVRAPNGQGGGGGAAGFVTSTAGGHGGGWFAVYAVETISVGGTGSITATGQDGNLCAGGGGGGVVIFASKTAVSVAGSIDVSGGDGGESTSQCAAGGGGGGGMMMSISPSNSVPSGNVLVAGGNAGTGAAPNAPAGGGGGGGASRGSGGNGAGLATASTAGASGLSSTVTADPTSVILG